jgi:mannose-6-phosphate isomerase-like protein (cupin superfamily)
MAGAPRAVWMPGGVLTEIHLAGGDTSGAFCLLVDNPPVGWSLPAHRHLGEAETIHVLDGDFEVELEGTRRRLSAGETVYVPQGAMHASANVGTHPGRRIVLFSPAGLERFFLEAGTESPDGDVDPAGALALAIRYGWEFAPPG